MATQLPQSTVSEVSICNQALSWVGVSAIASLDEPSRAAEWCRNNYFFLRDAVLESRLWSFAIAKKITTTADRDEWDEYYTHPVPLEWLNVFRVYDNPKNPEQTHWKLEGKNVLTEEDTVYLWGVKRITDTGAFSNLFIQALCARMAADMAVPFTENARLQADMWALYDRKLEEAAARDGMQGRNEKFNEGLITQVRRGGGNVWR